MDGCGCVMHMTLPLSDSLAPTHPFYNDFTDTKQATHVTAQHSHQMIIPNPFKPTQYQTLSNQHNSAVIVSKDRGAGLLAVAVTPTCKATGTNHVLLLADKPQPKDAA